MSEELKTLEDLFNDVDTEADYSGREVKEVLKQEGIKWFKDSQRAIKELEGDPEMLWDKCAWEGQRGFIRDFFNITEEEQA